MRLTRSSAYGHTEFGHRASRILCFTPAGTNGEMNLVRVFTRVSGGSLRKFLRAVRESCQSDNGAFWERKLQLGYGCAALGGPRKQFFETMKPQEAGESAAIKLPANGTFGVPEVMPQITRKRH